MPLAVVKVNENGIRMPAIPAPPNSSAYTDQPNDAVTARLTRVSIVAAPWPSPASAVRCSGRAPQPATGAASSRLTHCQPLNCADGTIARAITPAASGTHTASRRPRSLATGSAPPLSSADGAGSSAWYPADLITPISSAASRSPVLVKYARPVA